ncbi:MAG: hypothetical protein CVV27_04175 [Candidatus Melainabacteria bacterium HGW-Melainabacteria-1]|nr:MAG: hypothetical protein CVV27_04175 [Candidatus Melainabacteria bacterium HGW-Melainabacteria-1]
MIAASALPDQTDPGDADGPSASESEQQLAEICRSIPGAVFQLRLAVDGQISLPFISEGIERLSGLTPEALLKYPQQLYNLLHLYDRKAFFQAMEDSARELVAWSQRFRFRHSKTQEYRWVRWDATPKARPDGSVIWNGTLLDVHEAETATEMLRVQSRAIESMNQGLLILDPHHLGMPVIYANRQYCDMMACGLEDVLGQDSPFLQGILRHAEPAGRIRQAIRAGRPFSGETLSIRKDGSPCWHLLTLSPVFDLLGKLTHFVALYTDVSELKKAVEDLRQSDERFRLLASATHQAIWDWDMLSGQLDWSEGLQEIFGHQPSELQSVIDWRIEGIHPDDRPRVLASMQQVLSEEQPFWQGEYRFLDAQSHYHWVLDRACILYADAMPVRMIGAMFDVSLLKDSEETLRRLNQELLRQNRDLEQFSYITSHNLRAPVANILGLSQLLEEEEVSAEFQHSALQGIQLAAQNLDRVIQDLNRILSQRQHILEDREDVQVQGLIDMVMANLSMLAAETRPEFSVTLGVESLFSVRSYLESIVQNLLSNAMKYRDPERALRIEILTERQGETVRLQIRDNGLGMNLPQIRGRLFQLYKRFHPHIEGQGLGLYLVKTQIEALGGRVDVESEPGLGTTFTLELRDDKYL